jgi:hypothetical protein
MVNHHKPRHIVWMAFEIFQKPVALTELFNCRVVKENHLGMIKMLMTTCHLSTNHKTVTFEPSLSKSTEPEGWSGWAATPFSSSQLNSRQCVLVVEERS